MPRSDYEGALALGATHERSVYTAVVPAARSGILAGVVLGVGRAMGETMAVIMVAGNQPRMPKGILQGVRTLTGNIVIEMAMPPAAPRGADRDGRGAVCVHPADEPVLLCAQEGEEGMRRYRNHIGSLALALLTHLAAAVTVLALGFLVGYVLIRGVPNLNADMFSLAYTSDNQSMLPAILNTCTMTLLALLAAVPFGIASAIYLAEYAKKGSKIVALIRVTTETLSGIPSIVYGLFGMLFFSGKLRFGYSMLSGALTLAIMILPLIMRTTEEALLSVPDMYREGSFGLGAGRLRTVTHIVLPTAIPGILSGVILAIGRIVGETAALMYTSGTVEKVAGLMDSGSTLALHMYKQASEGLYTEQAYATSVILLALVLLINFCSSRIAKLMMKGRE